MKLKERILSILALLIALSLCLTGCDGAFFTHEHVFDQEVEHVAYLRSKANCERGAIYCKSCVCGAKGYETFMVGDAIPHEFSEEWSFNASSHWHGVACGHTYLNLKADLADHEFVGDVCSVCGYNRAI